MTDTVLRAPVVVGVLGSLASLCATEWAVDEAASRGVPLRLVHVVDPASATPVDSQLDYAAGVLVSATAAVRARRKPVIIDTAIVSGSPTAVLTDESARAGLLCVGIDGGKRDGIGPTAAALARQAHCPVAIIRDGSPRSALHVGGIVLSFADLRHRDCTATIAFLEARLRRVPILVVVRESGHVIAQDDDVLDALARWRDRCPDVRLDVTSSSATIFGYLADHPGQGRLVVIGAGEVEQLETADAQHRAVVGRSECCIIVAR